jgi:hypothetical protein
MYTQLKKLTVADVQKAANVLSNLAMNLSYRGIAHRDVGVLVQLSVDELRKLPAEFRVWFPIGKAKGGKGYIFSAAKAKHMREALGYTDDAVIAFEEFAQKLSAKIEEDTPEPIEPTLEELKAKAAKAVATGVRMAFRAGLSKHDVARILAQVEVEARGTASEAKAAPKAETTSELSPELPQAANAA